MGRLAPKGQVSGGRHRHQGLDLPWGDSDESCPLECWSQNLLGSDLPNVQCEGPEVGISHIGIYPLESPTEGQPSLLRPLCQVCAQWGP